MVDAVVEGIPKDELTVERVRTEVRALTEKIAAKQVRPQNQLRRGHSHAFEYRAFNAMGEVTMPTTHHCLMVPDAHPTVGAAAYGGIEVSRAH